MPEGEKIGGERGSSKGTFLSYLQRDEHFNFLNLEIWILLTENCLEMEDVFKKFDSLEACKGKKAVLDRLAQPQKLQKFKLSSSVK